MIKDVPCVGLEILVAPSELTQEEADLLLATAKSPTGTPEEREERRAEVEVCSLCHLISCLFLIF
jgi:hypothetical protein